MLADRLKQAIEVLGSDHTIGGTLRQQAAAYFGENVDDRALNYMSRSAIAIHDETVRSALAQDFSDQDADNVAVTMVLIAGAAIGKRLGIEDGEAFARGVADVD